MKKSLKKILSSILAFTMAAGAFTFTDAGDIVIPNAACVEAYAAETPIIEEGGWFESAYAKWSEVEGADGYAAYVKGASQGESSYKLLDNELIRKYPDHWRADALGLKAGSYVIKIVPYKGGEPLADKAFTTGTLEVKAYDRSGAAFSSKSQYKTGSGAYNDDGTLKDGAIVLYVTKDTAKTVQATLKTDGKGKTETATGIQSILDLKQKGSGGKSYDTTPMAIRIIGKVSLDDLDHISSSEEGLQIKGNNSYSEMNVTIEGVGDDATISGFGILIRNTGNVEFRNFALMAYMDDGISIDTDNCNTWVHNVDFFYGSTGSDGDQAKGDGSLDMKGDSTYITASYNHFWDSGKCSLCGMKSEHTSSHITYHHNWFDHSDSRHPRIRTMSVHVYNNFFDGNAKYGVGVTMGSSAFVEANYFQNGKHSMLSSMQGSDIKGDSEGTFSSEDGGIIKAYNNKIINSRNETIYYSDSANVEFDAYKAENREDRVPSSVVTKKGGTSYNNFDTDTSNFDLAVNDMTPVDDVPAVVMAGAGRMNGGDFPADRSKYVQMNRDPQPGDDEKDKTGAKNSCSVDTEFKADILAYESSLVSVGGLNNGETPETSTDTTEETTSETTTETVSQPSTDYESTTETTEPTTETTEPTTASDLEPIATGTPVVGYTPSDAVLDGDNTIIYNADKDNYTLHDTSTTAATTWEIPFDTQTSGVIVVKGKMSVTKVGSKWAMVLLKGKKSDGTSGELVSFACDNDKNLAIRTAGTDYTTFGTAMAKDTDYDYEFKADIDNNKVTLTINGVSQEVDADIAEISSIYLMTGKSPADRDIIATLPQVFKLNEAQPTGLWGDADGDGKLKAVDSSYILQHTLNPIILGLSEDRLYWLDVDGVNGVNAADAAQVLQKVLLNTYKFPVEEK